MTRTLSPSNTSGAGRYRAYCPSAGYQPVAAASLMRYSVSEEWITQTIASPLGFTSQSSASEAAARPIGRAKFGPYPCHLFFARMLSDRARFCEAKTSVTRLMGSSPAVLMTTTSLDLIPGDPPSRCALLHLETVLRAENGRVKLEEDPFYSALRGPSRHSGEGIGFSFSPGFRSACWGDQDYSFTNKQAQAIEALYEAWKNGTGRLHQDEIKGLVGSNQRMTQIFRGHPAYGTLIELRRRRLLLAQPLGPRSGVAFLPAQPLSHWFPHNDRTEKRTRLQA